MAAQAASCAPAGVRGLSSVLLCAGVGARGPEGSALLGHLVSPPTRQSFPQSAFPHLCPAQLYEPHAAEFWPFSLRGQFHTHAQLMGLENVQHHMMDVMWGEGHPWMDISLLEKKQQQTDPNSPHPRPLVFLSF